MYIQSSIALVVLGLAAKAVVAATPPACLLAALKYAHPSHLAPLNEWR